MFNGEIVFNDKELKYIEKAAQGDHNAFRQLVLAYETPVLTYLQSILGDWEQARDLAQETFIAAFYALPRWTPPELLNQRQSLSQESWQSAHSIVEHPLAPWLYRIATNHALTFLKQQSKYKRAEVSLHSSQRDETVSLPQGSVKAWEDRYAIRELLHEALSQLSADDALCITLRFVAGERYAEIAEHLGTTKEAVRKRVARGLVTLRSVYQALDEEKS